MRCSCNTGNSMVCLVVLKQLVDVIEEFNKQCSFWRYNLSEQERERFQEMADR
jgi:hypothetical protein